MRSRADGNQLPLTGTTFGTRLPKMPRSLVAVLHIGYWGLYLLLLAMMVIGNRMRTPVPEFLFSSSAGFLLIAPNVVAFYVQYFVLTPRLFPKKRFGLLALFSVLTAVSVSVLCAVVLSLASGRAFPLLSSSLADAAAFFAWLSVLALIHMTLAMVIRGFISWYDDIAVKEQLAQKTSDVEAALLRAKLDPHFLFNTLNNIDVLISRDASAASSYVNQLSDILRYVLYDARAERVPLDAELAYVEKYIALQRIRVTNPKLVSYSLSGNTRGLSIAPMLLIPFVENAFKHAAGERDDNAIAVAIVVEQSALTFVCSNSYQRTSMPRPLNDNGALAVGGLGRALMQQRLELLYPRAHVLAVSDSNYRYSVRLDLTLESRNA
ncbi:MAG: histidine kinase [Gemmatimonas sp.]